MIQIIFLSIFIRLFSLNQSLWLDEGTTAKVVLNYNFWEIFNKFSLYDFHPPLYYLLMKVWTTIVGYSEVALRLPSVIFCVFTGYVIYLIGKEIKDKKTGLWSAVFFLCNPLIMYYSQEARMYMMTTFLLTSALFFLLKILHDKSKIIKIRYVILFGICISLSFATFYGSIFFIIPLILILLYRTKYKEFIISSSMLFLGILILSPLIAQQFQHSRESLIAVINWKSVLGTVSLKNLMLIPLKFAFGRISFYPKILYYAIAGIWSLFVWIIVVRGILKNKLLGFLLFAPLGFGLLFSLSSPLLQYFRFLFLIPIMSILISFACSKNYSYKLLSYILATGFVILSGVYLIFPQFHREDWKSLAVSLPQNIPVYMIKSSSDALEYYRRDLQLFELRNSVLVTQKIIVIPYTSDIYGYDYKNDLDLKDYRNISTISNFQGLSYEIWQHNKIK